MGDASPKRLIVPSDSNSSDSLRISTMSSSKRSISTTTHCSSTQKNRQKITPTITKNRVQATITTLQHSRVHRLIHMKIIVRVSTPLHKIVNQIIIQFHRQETLRMIIQLIQLLHRVYLGRINSSSSRLIFLQLTI